MPKYFIDEKYLEEAGAKLTAAERAALRRSGADTYYSNASRLEREAGALKGPPQPTDPFPAPRGKGNQETFDNENGQLTGRNMLPLSTRAMEINQETLSVFRNGISLVQGHDYTLDTMQSTVVLSDYIRPIDDYIEVRYEYFNGDTVESVLLLARGKFTMEQLESLAPDIGDEFTINRLIEMNPKLIYHPGSIGRVYQFVVTEDGIIGDLQILPKFPRHIPF